MGRSGQYPLHFGVQRSDPGALCGCQAPPAMAMRFCYARFARCRNSHLSAWSRNVNFQLHRGIASAAVRAAETRPQNGWAEQRFGSCLGPATCSEASLEGGSTTSDAVAALICSLMEMDAALAGRCSEYLDLSVLGHFQKPGHGSPWNLWVSDINYFQEEGSQKQTVTGRPIDADADPHGGALRHTTVRNAPCGPGGRKP
eukprot:s118_g20.t1